MTIVRECLDKINQLIEDTPKADSLPSFLNSAFYSSIKRAFSDLKTVFTDPKYHEEALKSGLFSILPLLIFSRTDQLIRIPQETLNSAVLAQLRAVYEAALQDLHFAFSECQSLYLSLPEEEKNDFSFPLVSLNLQLLGDIKLKKVELKEFIAQKLPSEALDSKEKEKYKQTAFKCYKYAKSNNLQSKNLNLRLASLFLTSCELLNGQARNQFSLLLPKGGFNQRKQGGSPKRLCFHPQAIFGQRLQH